jgi:hypothetical protein
VGIDRAAAHPASLFVHIPTFAHRTGWLYSPAAIRLIGNQGYEGSAKRQAAVPGRRRVLLRTVCACASIAYDLR